MLVYLMNFITCTTMTTSTVDVVLITHFTGLSFY